MNACKDFSKKHPVILVILSVVLMEGLLRLMRLVPDSSMNLAITEGIMAVVVVAVVILFMGREKVSFSPKGFGYTFRLLRGYFIVMAVVAVMAFAGSILLSVVAEESVSIQPLAVINVFIGAIFIGIVEEFVFRGLIFGGLVQKLGNAKKSIILAAVISGLLFGVMHVLDYALAGEITDTAAVVSAVLKTAQTGIFGIVLAFVYYKTRNLFAVAAVHSLDDFLLLISTVVGNGQRTGYVATDGNASRYIVTYVFFTLILVPSLVRSIKSLKAEEAIPFDEDFLPRKVEFVKKAKMRSKKNAD